MIDVKCTAVEELCLKDLKPFQGELKVRTSKDVDALAASLRSDGLIMPFAVWSNGEHNSLLDGHGRLQALIKLAISDPSILDQKFPVTRVKADNEADARKALLQIVSTYGKINKNGVIKFSSDLVNYVSPITTKYRIAADKRVSKECDSSHVIVRVAVERDKVAAFVKLLKDVDGVDVQGDYGV